MWRLDDFAPIADVPAFVVRYATFLRTSTSKHEDMCDTLREI
jgi:hypothetical protein